MVAHEQDRRSAKRGPRVDDKMIINGLWGLVVLLLGAFATWLEMERRSLWKALRSQDKEAEEQISALAEATKGSISALHEKTNQISREVAAAMLDGERHHASKADLEKTEKYLGDALNNLTVAVADLRAQLSQMNKR